MTLRVPTRKRRDSGSIGERAYETKAVGRDAQRMRPQHGGNGVDGSVINRGRTRGLRLMTRISRGCARFRALRIGGGGTAWPELR